jgi:hypothetical protein
MKILLICILLATTLPLNSQVNLEWAACYNGPANDRDAARAICVDDSGFVYVTGSSRDGSGNFNFATIKYDTFGNELWVKRYSGPLSGSYVANDIITDDSGNVYITGTISTIKYDRNGNLIWLSQMSEFSAGERIILDQFNNIIVAGTSLNDYITIYFDINGELLWQQLYNGTGNFRDEFSDMVIDSKGDIIVTGQSHGIGTHWDYATIKYSIEGDSLWVRRYNGPCSSFPGDYAFAVTVDDENNVYVTGWSDGINCNAQCFTIAYSPTGDILWEHRYPGIGYAGYDVLYSEEYIYVVARSGGIEDVLLKYDKQGNLIWNRSYISDHLFATIPPGLATDAEGNIYLRTINWNNSELRSNFVLLKYNTDGTMLWEYNYPGYGTSTANAANDFVIDVDGNIYLTGSSQGWVCPGGGLDYLTIKVSQDKVGVNPNSEIISDYHLFQNYPNPFNPFTTIKFSLPIKEFVTLKIYDLLGKEVRTLLTEERHAGTHSLIFDAEGMPSGIYYYRLTSGKFTQTRKLILLR